MLGAAGVQSQVCAWVPVGASKSIVSGGWNMGLLMVFGADVGMSTCPKARVLIPSGKMYLLVSRGAKGYFMYSLTVYYMCARDLKPGISSWSKLSSQTNRQR